MVASHGKNSTSSHLYKKNLVRTSPIYAKGKRGFYGRRLGRPLSPVRQKAIDELYPRYAVAEESVREDGTLDPASLFSSPSSGFVLEIGFGQGERLAQMMERHPDKSYIGCEPFLNGMSNLLLLIADKTLPNLKLWMDDAMRLVRSLSDACVDELYILNPDPWHKSKHFKRRMVNPVNLDEFARVIKPGGMLYLSTDVPDLADWMAAHTVNHGAFHWTASSKADWEQPPKDWISTKYETKGAKGAKKMCYLVFERKA